MMVALLIFGMMSGYRGMDGLLLGFTGGYCVSYLDDYPLRHTLARTGLGGKLICMGCLREWLLRSWEVKLNHISRQSNMVADWFAKNLRDQMVSTVFFEEPPDEIHTLLEDDMQCPDGTYG
ncbi:hypothetical protein V6N11_048092 [Hibiscus sabdariffa]|uniref:RNase H type-1 domain-containing protein n=1 Tax=Hibiscus sabdariffa TaxID=183260 RepID=A0ABR2NRM4_9ROSI